MSERLVRIKKDYFKGAHNFWSSGDYGFDGTLEHLFINKDFDWLIEQAEESIRLREENYQLRTKYENTGTMLDRSSLRAENRKLREALDFYANQENHLLPPVGTFEADYFAALSAVRKDCGEVARKALENTK